MSPALPVSGAPLHAAARIGQSLCRQAFWDRGGLLCNWMGRVVVEVDRVGGPITPTSAALGPDLYGGSAGIALFLAELFAATGDPECRRTTLGAIARSIRQLDRLPEGSPSPISFFVGHLGVAFAADRLGRLTGDLGVRTRAEALLDRVAAAATAPTSWT